MAVVTAIRPCAVNTPSVWLLPRKGFSLTECAKDVIAILLRGFPHYEYLLVPTEKCGSNNGRISIEELLAAGWRAAHSSAASRSGTSMIPNEARNSLVSAYGPSWTCCFPSRTVTVVAT